MHDQSIYGWWNIKRSRIAGNSRLWPGTTVTRRDKNLGFLPVLKMMTMVLQARVEYDLALQPFKRPNEADFQKVTIVTIMLLLGTPQGVNKKPINLVPSIFQYGVFLYCVLGLKKKFRLCLWKHNIHTYSLTNERNHLFSEDNPIINVT